MKGTITSEGVWHIRRRERSPVIEVFRQEDTGHGDILSREFLDWRSQDLTHGTGGTEDLKAAKTRLLSSINSEST